MFVNHHTIIRNIPRIPLNLINLLVCYFQLKKRFFSSSFDSIRDHLDDLNGVEGFIYKNYTEEGTRDNTHVRKYFTAENGKHIDAVRQKIEEWKNNKIITTKEYFVLLAALIESVPFYSNISGVYGAFLKQYDPRALKKLKIKPMQFYGGEKDHKVYNGDSMKLIGKERFDILMKFCELALTWADRLLQCQIDLF